jgi:Tfp pilus assembly protein PilF
MGATRARGGFRTWLAAHKVVAPLAIILLGVLGVYGCGHFLFGGGAEQQFWKTVRPISGDTARLLRNAHYFKLMGRPELAAKELEEAHQLEPTNLKVLNSLAQTYEELGDFARAQKLYQEALLQDSSNQALNNNLCFSYYQAGQWDQAEDCFRQALTQNPQNVAARNNLGLLLCRTGRLEEAHRLWKEAEGEAVALNKINQVMTALGQDVPPAFAQRHKPSARPASRAASKASPSAVQTAARPESQPARPSLARTAAPSPKEAVQPSAPKAKEPARVVSQPAPAPPPMQAAARTLPPTRAPAAGPPAPATPASNRGLPSPITEKAATHQGARPAPGKLSSSQAVTPEERHPAETASISEKKPAPAPPAAAKPEERPQAAPLARPAPPTTETPQVAARPSPKPAQAPAQVSPPPQKQGRVAVKARPAPAKPSGPAQATVAAMTRPKRQPPLTVDELVNTGIEVLNGNGTRNYARRTRLMLSLEGFSVARIGNHVDFGAEETSIYYRPGTERVVRVVNAKFFQAPQVKESTKLPAGVDIKIILGRDLLARQELSSRLARCGQPPKETPALTKTVTTIKPPAPGSQPVPPVGPAPRLTAQELKATAIEIHNGNGAKNIARRTRTLLSLEGFKVARIGNHLDFGAQQTVIYYRPGTEKVAQALQAKFFRTSKVEQSARLPRGVDIKVILGQDLLRRQELMAKWTR